SLTRIAAAPPWQRPFPASCGTPDPPAEQRSHIPGMHREPLLALLGRHVPGDPSEAVSLERIIDFVRSEPRCFLRESLEAHVTASALVLDRRHERALLTWHSKSNRWIYLGGHCDGDPDVLGVARRELVEESGLEHSRLLLEAPFYVDVD